MTAMMERTWFERAAADGIVNDIRIASLCTGYGGASGCGAMFTDPLLDIFGRPHLAHGERVHGRREVRARDDLLNALSADAEPRPDLRRTHQVMHSRHHSRDATSHLTRGQQGGQTSHMPSPLRDGVCVICSRPYQTRTKTAETCGDFRCRALLREQRHPSPGAPRKEDDPEFVEKIRELYDAGHSMAEVAELAGTTVKVLQRVMPRNDIERRPSVKRDQRGEKNASWLGDQAGYSALHLRVIVARGRPAHCERCGTSDPDIQYDWANLTGHYEDVNDYERMCPACHVPFDAKRRAETGMNTCTLPIERGGW